MSSPCVKTCLPRVNTIISTEILQRIRYVLSFVKTCLQMINAMSSTKIIQSLRYALSFCEDMSSKDKFPELTNHSSEVTLCPLLL